MPQVLQQFDFSNFDPMHAPILYEGLKYETTEHFFQAMKSKDISHRVCVSRTNSPGSAKAMGRRVRLRPDWSQIREDVMMFGLLHKFAEGTDWRRRLDATGDAIIVEWNTWHDNIWGQCVCERCRDRKGWNLLGKALMKIRDGEVQDIPARF